MCCNQDEEDENDGEKDGEKEGEKEEDTSEVVYEEADAMALYEEMFHLRQKHGELKVSCLLSWACRLLSVQFFSCCRMPSCSRTLSAQVCCARSLARSLRLSIHPSIHQPPTESPTLNAHALVDWGRSS